MMGLLKRISASAVVIAAAFLALASSAPALAAKVHLKDGQVMEGRIAREGEGFVILMVKVGDIERQEIITNDKIKKIDRDAAPEGAQASDTPALKPSTPTASPSAAIPPGATKIAFISLEEMVGPYLNANALLESAKKFDDLPENERPDVLVLRINSGGGALSEVEPLSDAIHEKLKPKYRVVAWVESAISAASMTALNCEEIYFKKEGNFGGSVAFRQLGGRTEALKDDGLEWVLQLGELLSRRGQYNPLMMRAMQVYMDLSCDIDSDGNITWYDTLDGEYTVNTKDKILTFNSVDAKKFGLSRGTADTKDELARLMGCPEWVEVGPKADEHQRAFREAVKTAEARQGELMAKMQIAQGAGEPGKIRTYLNELRSLARQAPSMEFYGNPPLNKEFFEFVEKEIRKLVEEQERAKKRQ